MSLPSDLKGEACMLLSLARNWFRNHWRGFSALQALLLVLIWAALHPYDHALLAAVRHSPLGMTPEKADAIAGGLSYWGDFPRFNVALALALWGCGLVCKRPRWQRLAVMTVLAAALAGLTTNIVRLGLGRSRPNVAAADGFYGPQFNNQFQSCPSGHTTTAFAAAIPLLITSPPMGVATTLVACGVGWSRMMVNRHYPADVAMGLWMALWFAVPLGFAARVRRMSDEPA